MKMAYSAVVTRARSGTFNGEVSDYQSYWSSLSTSVSSITAVRRSRLATKISLGSSTRSFIPSEPLDILKLILDLLLEHDVPGPLLFRLKKEFSDKIGEGTFAEVFALSGECEAQIQRYFMHNSSRHEETALSRLPHFKEQDVADKDAPGLIAIKRARLHLPSSHRKRDNTQTHPSLESTQHSNKFREDFQRQLTSVLQEVQLLSRPFMKHRNIVKLLGWGLCLDTLEDETTTEPVVPLLVLERAQLNLFQAIATESRLPELDWDNGLRDICLDVGRGLQAIHSAGLVHGDLKLHNILLFRQVGASGQDSYIAKLCDFGSSRQETENVAERKEAARVGTKNWQPPAESYRVRDGPLHLSDVYSFGWVVWCSATLQTEPLPWQSARDSISLPTAHGDLEAGQCVTQDGPYQRAKKSFLESNGHWTPSADLTSEQKRILRVLVSSLHEDKGLWESEPWKILDVQLYTVINYVDEQVTSLSALARRVGQVYGDACDCYAGFFSTYKATLFDHTSAARQRIWTGAKRRSMHLRQMGAKIETHILISLARMNFTAVEASKATRKTEAVEEILGLLIRFDNLAGVNDMRHDKGVPCNMIPTLVVMALVESHQELFPDKGWYSYVYSRYLEIEFEGMPLSELHANVIALGSFIRRFSPEVRLYAIARVRSRFSLCCWKASCRDNWYADLHLAHNNPDDYILHDGLIKMPLSTLAWFLKGDIGLSELSEKVDLATTGPTSGFRSLAPSSLASVWVMTGKRNKDHYQLLLLLLERGCRLDCKVRHLGKEISRFRVFLETALQSTHASDILYITRFCRRLVFMGRMRDLCPPYRFFLTGRAHLHLGGLPDQARESEDASDWNEFPTTALHEAISAHSKAAVAAILTTDFDVNARDGAGMSAVQLAIRLSEDLSPDFDQPVNEIMALLRQDKRIIWDAADIKAHYNDPPLGWQRVESDCMDGFFENHSGSFTLHPPSFGFLGQQRLILGFRRNLSYTYALDPLRFLGRKEDRMSIPASRHKTSVIFNDDWYEREIYGDHRDDELYLHLESKLDKPSFIMAAFSTTWAGLSSFVASASTFIASTSWRAWASLENLITTALSKTWTKLSSFMTSASISVTGVFWIACALLGNLMTAAISKLRALGLIHTSDILFCLIPLIVLSEFRHWAPLPRLMLSALPFIPLKFNISVLALTLGYNRQERVHTLGLVTVLSQLDCSPEYFVGIFLLLSGQRATLDYLIFASLVTRLLLFPGLIIAVTTCKRREHVLTKSTTMPQLNLLFFAVILSGFQVWVSTSISQISLEQLQRGTATIPLMLYVLWLWARLKSKGNLVEDDRSTISLPNVGSLRVTALMLMGCLIMSALCAYSFVGALRELKLSNSTLLCCFLFLAATRPDLLYLFMIVIEPSYDEDRMNLTIFSVISSSLGIIMLINPLLNLISPWSDSNTMFTSLWTVIVVWVVKVVFSHKTVNYMSGFVLITLYLILVLATFLLPPSGG